MWTLVLGWQGNMGRGKGGGKFFGEGNRKCYAPSSSPRGVSEPVRAASWLGVSPASRRRRAPRLPRAEEPRTLRHVGQGHPYADGGRPPQRGGEVLGIGGEQEDPGGLAAQAKQQVGPGPLTQLVEEGPLGWQGRVRLRQDQVGPLDDEREGGAAPLGWPPRSTAPPAPRRPPGRGAGLGG